MFVFRLRSKVGNITRREHENTQCYGRVREGGSVLFDSLLSSGSKEVSVRYNTKRIVQGQIIKAHEQFTEKFKELRVLHCCFNITNKY